jgi:hypothetical protein
MKHQNILLKNARLISLPVASYITGNRIACG